MNKAYLSKGHAYVYLKTLFTKSGVFKKWVEDLRVSLDIKKPFSTDVTSYPTNWNELYEKRRNYDLSKNELFQNFCEYFFIPKCCRSGFAVYLYTNRTTQIFDDSLKIFTSTQDTPIMTRKGKSLVPYTALYIPYGISREELASKWKNIIENQQLINNFLQGVHKWKDGLVFDAALTAHRVRNGRSRIKDTEIDDALVETGLYKTKRGIPTHEVKRNAKHIKTQVAALNGWYTTYYS